MGDVEELKQKVSDLIPRLEKAASERNQIAQEFAVFKTQSGFVRFSGRASAAASLLAPRLNMAKMAQHARNLLDQSRGQKDVG